MGTKQELAEEATIAKLRKLAADNDVDLKGASKKDELVEVIVASRKVTVEDLKDALDEPSAEASDVTGNGSGGPSADDTVSPTGTANVAGTNQSQLDMAPPQKDESGSHVPAPNMRQPVIEEALPSKSDVTPQSLDPALVDPDKAAAERAEGRTSDAKTRDENTHVDEVAPDLNVGVKPSDGGEERYPFPPQGDVEVASVEPGSGEGEYMLPLEVEDWVVLDGSHELVPDRLDGRRAAVLDAPRYLIPESARADTWITCRTRDDVNATLHIPLDAVKSIEKNGTSPLVRS
jgi:hypothetical protein